MSTTNPSVVIGTTALATSAQVYANDAAFVAGKGSSAAAGDFYYNSTDGMIHWYDAVDGNWETATAIADAQTLTNKTLTSATVSDKVIFTESSAPSTPSSGTAAVYAKTDGLLYSKDDAGVETQYAYPMRQNWIMNGNMDLWQRGTSFVAISHSAKAADRWRYTKVNSGAAHTVSRSTDVPTLSESSFQSSYSILTDCTTADASADAADIVTIGTILEGYQWAQLKGNEVTLSFWVKATKTGIHCVSFRNNGSDRFYIAEYTINATDTWERKTITLTLNPSGGTDDFTTGAGLRIDWALLVGSNSHGTAGSWQTGAKYATANQVNACDDTANNFRLAQVMLVVGTGTYRFSRMGQTIAHETQICERFYQKSYSFDVDPGTASSAGAMAWVHGSATGAASCWVTYRTAMRSAPTVTVYSTAGTSGKFKNVSDDDDENAAERSGYGGSRGTSLATSAAGEDGDIYACHWTADADF